MTVLGEVAMVAEDEATLLVWYVFDRDRQLWGCTLGRGANVDLVETCVGAGIGDFVVETGWRIYTNARINYYWAEVTRRRMIRPCAMEGGRRHEARLIPNLRGASEQMACRRTAVPVDATGAGPCASATSDEFHVDAASAEEVCLAAVQDHSQRPCEAAGVVKDRLECESRVGSREGRMTSQSCRRRRNRKRRCEPSHHWCSRQVFQGDIRALQTSVSGAGCARVVFCQDILGKTLVCAQANVRVRNERN